MKNKIFQFFGYIGRITDKLFSVIAFIMDPIRTEGRGGGVEATIDML